MMRPTTRRHLVCHSFSKGGYYLGSSIARNRWADFGFVCFLLLVAIALAISITIATENRTLGIRATVQTP